MGELTIKTVFKGMEVEFSGEESGVIRAFREMQEEWFRPSMEVSAPADEAQALNIVEPVGDNQIREPEAVKEVKNVKKAVETKTTTARRTPKKIEHYNLKKLALDKTESRTLKDKYLAYNTYGSVQSITTLFYLYREMAKVQSFDIDLTYSLLKTVGEIIPKVLSQTLRDIKNKKGYIDRNEDGTYSLTHIGESFVEHELSDSVI